MSDPPRKLNQIQRWMQAVITHPLGVEPGVGSDAAREQIDVAPDALEEVVTRSNALSSSERLAVYSNAYYARLLECMGEFFPVLTYALGEDLFNQFAFDYLQRYPSASYTLNRLADEFVRFLEETRPNSQASDESGDAPSADWPDFMIDLARLEWTIDEVFDGPGVEDEPLLTDEQLAAIPADRWPEARLTPVVCLRLLEFKYPVNAYFTAFRGGEEPQPPEPAGTYVALTRRNYIVRRIELSRPQYELLSALAQGSTVGEAVHQAAAQAEDLDELATSLQNWFHIWSAEGLFHRVELSD